MKGFMHRRTGAGAQVAVQAHPRQKSSHGKTFCGDRIEWQISVYFTLKVSQLFCKSWRDSGLLIG